MRIALLSFAVLLMGAGLAGAQDNVIKIINEDGSVTLFDPYAGQEGPKPELEPQTGQPKQAALSPKASKPEPEGAERVDQLATESTLIVPKELEKPVIEKKAKKPAVKKASAPKPERRPAEKIKRQQELEQSIEQAGSISEDMALQIALDVAPPSRGFRVSLQSLEDKPVYAVLFRTHEGPYEVLVDGQSGKVLSSGPVETAPAQPAKPGHLLPPRL